MKVLPLHNLIVCAIPPQTIVRQCVLAAVAYVSVLCGAARVQSAPAAPPLTLWNAVELSHGTDQDETYILEHSTDLSLWTAIGGPVYGDGDQAGHLVSAFNTNAASGFYRLKVNTRPPEGKSRWSMDGCRMLLNTSGGACVMTFGSDATGSMMAADAGLAAFTWDWQRTGLDTGRATVTWPGGIVETMDLQFTGEHAGVFSSRKTAEGLFAGAASGTFRDDAAASLAQSAPSSLTNVLLTVSGTGRATGIEVNAFGNAMISGPAGPAGFACSYTRRSAAEAEMILTNEEGTTETWLLTFTGPACGTCAGTTERNGILRRTASGNFTIAPR